MKTANKRTSEKIKQMDRAYEVAITATVITHHCFDEAYKYMGLKGEGVIGTYDEITRLATLFVKEHTHVKEWEAFCHDVGYSDWEEWVYVWALDKLKD